MNTDELLLIFVYIIFLNLQIYYHYNNIKLFKLHDDVELNKNIEYNNNNREFLNNAMYREINNRINMLNNKKFSFYEWIKYNRENLYVNFNNNNYSNKYSITIVEETNNNYYFKVYYNKLYENISWDDFIYDKKNILVNSKYETDKNLLNNMFNTNFDNNNYTVFSFFFINENNNIVKKNAIFKKYDFKNHKGIIYMTYDVENISDNITFCYSNVTPIYIKILSTATSFFIPYLLYIIDRKDIVYSIIILIVLNLYNIYYFNLREIDSSISIENDKLSNINSSILSISFLLATTIFILNTFTDTKGFNHIFIKSYILFVISFIFLLMSIFKLNNYSKYIEILRLRVTKQYIFNYSILLIFCIIINYMLNIRIHVMSILKR